MGPWTRYISFARIVIASTAHRAHGWSRGPRVVAATSRCSMSIRWRSGRTNLRGTWRKTIYRYSWTFGRHGAVRAAPWRRCTRRPQGATARARVSPSSIPNNTPLAWRVMAYATSPRWCYFTKDRSSIEYPVRCRRPNWTRGWNSVCRSKTGREKQKRPRRALL